MWRLILCHAITISKGKYCLLMSIKIKSASSAGVFINWHHSRFVVCALFVQRRFDFRRIKCAIYGWLDVCVRANDLFFLDCQKLWLAIIQSGFSFSFTIATYMWFDFKLQMEQLVICFIKMTSTNHATLQYKLCIIIFKHTHLNEMNIMSWMDDESWWRRRRRRSPSSSFSSSFSIYYSQHVTWL